MLRRQSPLIANCIIRALLGIGVMYLSLLAAFLPSPLLAAEASKVPPINQAADLPPRGAREMKSPIRIDVDGRKMSKDEFLVEFTRKQKDAETTRKKAGIAESLAEQLAQESKERVGVNDAKVAEKKKSVVVRAAKLAAGLGEGWV